MTAGAAQAQPVADRGSVHPGDAVITGIDADRQHGRYEVTVRYDDLSTAIVTENISSSIEIFDERSRLRSLERDVDGRRVELRSKRLELHARKKRLYLWRGLRPDECPSCTAAAGGASSFSIAAGAFSTGAMMAGAATGAHAATHSGLAAKNAAASLSPEEALLRSASGQSSSQYIHTTLSAEAAVYYAATFASPDPNATAAAMQSCRVAQVDHSLISDSDIYDLSTAENCARYAVRDPRAVRYAVDHRVVLVRGYIPPEAVVGVHDLRPLGVPRNPPDPTTTTTHGSAAEEGGGERANAASAASGAAAARGHAAPEYLRRLGEAVPGMPEQIAGWVRSGCQRLLEEECERTGTGTGGGGRSSYPDHVVALAVVRGGVRAPREFEPLWRKILGRSR